MEKILNCIALDPELLKKKISFYRMRQKKGGVIKRNEYKLRTDT